MTNEEKASLRAKFYRGFADSNRLSILESLMDHPLTVTEIVKVTGLNQSNVSNHLICLKECSIVNYQKEGKYIRYSLRDDRIKDFLLLPEREFGDILESVSKCAQTFLDKKSCGCKKRDKVG
jgi:DNA-binding transcriptional ArsR family regulator